MNIRKFILNNSILKMGDLISRQNVIHYLEYYMKCQWWAREEHINYQNVKLNKLVEVSIDEVQFYKELYRKNGIRKGEIVTRGNIHKLPQVSKADLKNNYPKYCTRKTGWPQKEYFTSGSSGSPFAVLVDNVTMSQARALMILRAQYAGWEIGESVFQTGMSLHRGYIKKIKDILFGVYYASAYDLSDVNIDRYLEVIDRKKIKFLMGYPGSIFAIADRAKRVGFNVPMKGIVTWGDNLYQHFRNIIERQFQCKVTDTYGCGEGIQVAAQCPDGGGRYHIFMPHVIVEIVDDAGQPVSPGHSGNILLTRLEAGSMPLIRYKVGDVGRMADDIQCSCGRGFEMLASIDGRDSDFIYTPNGNKLIVHFFTGIFEYYPEIEDFRIIQENKNSIRVLLVHNDKFQNNVINNIRDEILEKGDKDLGIDFDIVERLDYTKTGKRKFVISNINNVC